jgi:hypothetical protein
MRGMGESPWWHSVSQPWSPNPVQALHTHTVEGRPPQGHIEGAAPCSVWGRGRIPSASRALTSCFPTRPVDPVTAITLGPEPLRTGSGIVRQLFACSCLREIRVRKDNLHACGAWVFRCTHTRLSYALVPALVCRDNSTEDMQTRGGAVVRARARSQSLHQDWKSRRLCESTRQEGAGQRRRGMMLRCSSKGARAWLRDVLAHSPASATKVWDAEPSKLHLGQSECRRGSSTAACRHRTAERGASGADRGGCGGQEGTAGQRAGGEQQGEDASPHQKRCASSLCPGGQVKSSRVYYAYNTMGQCCQGQCCLSQKVKLRRATSSFVGAQCFICSASVPV